MPDAEPLTTPRQEASLRDLGYPRRSGLQPAEKDAPAAVLARQVRVLPALRHLDTFRKSASRSALRERFPVTPEQVAEWRARNPKTRVSDAVAEALTFLSTFRGRR